MRNIVITGASGFIGGRAVERFQAEGWATTGVGRRSMKNSSAYLQQDLAEEFSTELKTRIAQADVVLHAAARSSPWGTKRQFHRDNVEATQRLLDACRLNGRPRFIFVSSSSVYYRAEDQLQMSEDTAQAKPAVNRYAHTKQLAEDLVRGYEGPWTILRPRAVYGPGDTVLFPRILAAAKAGRLPLLVRKGQPVIGDLIFVDNLVHYFLRAAETDATLGEFNLTDNNPVPIVDFLLSVFDQLQIARPRRQIIVGNAIKLATVIEIVYRLFCWWKEPPITRFGVHVFAWSKSFDVSKMLDAFGPPPATTQQGVEQFVHWIQAENPYS